LKRLRRLNDRGRIFLEIFGAFFIASIAAARWEKGHAITSLIAALGLAFYGFYRSVTLFVRNPALAYADKGVQFGGLLTVRDYRWPQVREIRETVWKRPYIPFMHWLPKERHYLEIEISGAGSVKLRSDTMELPAGGVKEVIASFRAAQIAVLGERGAAMARLGANQSERPGAPASALQAGRWQRLGLGEDAVDGSAEIAAPLAQHEPGLAPRPVFGRKVS
jgi:hypothetical protein